MMTHSVALSIPTLGTSPYDDPLPGIVYPYIGD